MSNTISKEVYEQYIDAATALFMEYYSCDLGENIRKQIETEGTDSFVMPKDLDDRCHELIKKECAKRQRNNNWSIITKGLRYVATFSIILLAALSVLFVSVEAVRVPIISYYVERSEGYWEISGYESHSDSDTNIPEKAFDVSDPLAGLLPTEYTLDVLDGESLDRLVAIYEKEPGTEVFFSAEKCNSNHQLDSEGAQISQTYQLCGRDIILVVEETEVRLAWIDEDLSTTFTLIATDMSSDSLLAIAEQLIGILSK